MQQRKGKTHSYGTYTTVHSINCTYWKVMMVIDDDDVDGGEGDAGEDMMMKRPLLVATCRDRPQEGK